MKMDYSKMDTMNKLMLTVLYSSVCYLFASCVPVTWQAAIIFMHYFTPVVLHVQLILSVTSGYSHKADETCTVVGYCTVSCGNLCGLLCSELWWCVGYCAVSCGDLCGLLYRELWWFVWVIVQWVVVICVGYCAVSLVICVGYCTVSSGNLWPM